MICAYVCCLFGCAYLLASLDADSTITRRSCCVVAGALLSIIGALTLSGVIP